MARLRGFFEILKVVLSLRKSYCARKYKFLYLFARGIEIQNLSPFFLSSSDVNWGWVKFWYVSTYSVPLGFRADLHDEARRAEFSYGSMDGMEWDGTEYLLRSLIFFILCGYIDKVYTYLYRY